MVSADLRARRFRTGDTSNTCACRYARSLRAGTRSVTKPQVNSYKTCACAGSCSPSGRRPSTPARAAPPTKGGRRWARSAQAECNQRRGSMTPKRKGTTWEAAIVTYLRGHGAPHAERRLAGSAKDRGDIAGIPGLVIEAKSQITVTLGAWLAEAETERANDGAAYGVVWHKRRGKTCAGDGYVTMTGATFVALLQAAGYVDPTTADTP